MKPKSVAAIVVSYNRRALLQECIEALLAQTQTVDAIFVIDNGSSDGSREYLDAVKANQDTVFVVLAESNTGGAGGFATGITTAFSKGFDWYWLMDDDAEPMPDALEKLMASEDAARTEVVAMCGSVFGIDKRLQYWHQGTFDSRMRLVTPMPELHTNASFQTDYMSFVGACIRHDAIQRVGFPAREYFVWNDDVEYTARLSRIGELRCVTASHMMHKDGENRDLVQRPHSIREWMETRRMPAATQWKHACGLRNYVDMVFRHRGPAPLWAASLFARRLARVLVFGDRRVSVIALYLRYFVQAVGRRQFETVLPADWKRSLGDS
ncbi:glycosyltransferase [Paraburkholderia phytofirmans]|uniref:Glycosyl transferase family 2 n=1 Tax=Paraburkholderia phytofirmans (strain DSM 17436 / LMG 22146 / PsJN) TaxID=398527 RepID=B2T0G7_PARPJ|nr:glycosyltransferase [Paraburkholderia phytofirmans]ACD15272.1 glycosyl transferase family 2 [Paraburkholderia phytofirmans PsJN]